ncbi:MAG: FixH family protein [Campylobacterota bacterium]|nr:FixH family protein [Campylobacterota bacterium]
MSKKDKALIWPYSIGASIVLVFGFCVATIIVSFERPVEPSDEYMRGYHDTDANINEIIAKEIAFNKRYTIEYVSQQINMKNYSVEYKINDVSGNPVDNAEVIAVVTRPNNHKHDVQLTDPLIENGIYTFKSMTLPEPGRWNIMVHVKVDGYERYYNLKADTRYESTFEY